jgi:hypothetical protein
MIRYIHIIPVIPTFLVSDKYRGQYHREKLGVKMVGIGQNGSKLANEQF